MCGCVCVRGVGGLGVCVGVGGVGVCVGGHDNTLCKFSTISMLLRARLRY